MRRFIWASYGMYFLGGMTSVLLGAVMPELLKHYGITYTSGGLIVLLQAIGAMAGVPIVLYFMNRVHYKYILSAAALASTVAQLTVLSLPPLVWIYVVAIISGAGISALETAVASYIMEAFVGRRAIFMSRLEVSFGLGALCLPAVSSVLIALGVWRFTFLIVGLFALFLALMWQGISVSLSETTSSQVQMDAQTAAPPEFRSRRSKLTILFFFLFMIFVYVGIEGSTNNFLPSIFTTYIRALPYYASLSTSVFWIAMVIGRFAIGWIARHVNYERYLLGSIFGTLICLVTLSQFQNRWLCFVIVFLLGVMMSAIYSITMVYANHTFPGMERTVTSAVTAFAGIGNAVFPAMIGFAMDHLVPYQVLLMLVGFTALLFASLLTIMGTLFKLRNSAKNRLGIS